MKNLIIFLTSCIMTCCVLFGTNKGKEKESEQAEELARSFLSLIQKKDFDKAKELLVTEEQVASNPDLKKRIFPYLHEDFVKLKKTVIGVTEEASLGEKIDVQELKFHEIKFRDSGIWEGSRVYQVAYHTLFRYNYNGTERKTNNRAYIILGNTEGAGLRIFGF